MNNVDLFKETINVGIETFPNTRSKICISRDILILAKFSIEYYKKQNGVIVIDKGDRKKEKRKIAWLKFNTSPCRILFM